MFLCQIIIDPCPIQEYIWAYLTVASRYIPFGNFDDCRGELAIRIMTCLGLEVSITFCKCRNGPTC